MKTLYLIHGWDGNPSLHWYPWLKKELQNLGWEVIIPEMPNTEAPVINDWVSHIQKVVKDINEDVYFVGHSIGCQTIMRYLETQKDPKIGGIVFVAGWFSLKNLESPEEKEISQPWIETPIDFNKSINSTANITAIFSDSDQFVPFEENKETFSEKFKCKIVVEHNKGHMIEEDGIKKLPSVLNSLLEMQ